MSTPAKNNDRPAANTRARLIHRTSSSIHYQTFPTAPPRSAGAGPPKLQQQEQQDAKHNRRPSSQGSRKTHSSSGSNGGNGNGSNGDHHHRTPLPKAQLAVLAVIALAEQTALNSISPYLPAMAADFPEVSESQVGLYVGLIASAFALAQFATNFLWGWLSDRVGRKPIVLTGTLLTAACFVAFGFSRTLGQAIAVQALMGLVNGNQGVISTCLGEITDRSNQSRAFTYLPVIYGIGGITGPLVGGLLVMRKNPFDPSKENPYPYLLPNLVSAAVLVVDFAIASIFLEESLEGARELPPLKKRIGTLFTWLWQFSSSHRPTYINKQQQAGGSNPSAATTAQNPDPSSSDEPDSTSDDDEDPSPLAQLLPDTGEQLIGKHVFNRDTILLLTTYLIFQLGNIGYNSLYPIFSEHAPPTGRGLSPEEIGTSLAFAGLVTIIFQVGIFGSMRERLGNKTTYRVGLLGFVIAFLLMPFVGYKDGGDGQGEPTTSGKIKLWAELGAILIVKTVAAVGGLTSALLLITNSAPSHQTLGTLNGLAQTLSAAGRAVGPFVSGSLFSAATRVKPKGEALAFGIFAGITFIGFLMSFGIRGAELEADGWEEEGEEEEGDEEQEVGGESEGAERRVGA